MFAFLAVDMYVTVPGQLVNLETRGSHDQLAKDLTDTCTTNTHIPFHLVCPG